MIRKLHFLYNVDATPHALAKAFVHRSVFMSPEDFAGVPTPDALKIDLSSRLGQTAAPHG